MGFIFQNFGCDFCFVQQNSVTVSQSERCGRSSSIPNVITENMDEFVRLIPVQWKSTFWWLSTCVYSLFKTMSVVKLTFKIKLQITCWVFTHWWNDTLGLESSTLTSLDERTCFLSSTRSLTFLVSCVREPTTRVARAQWVIRCGLIGTCNQWNCN